MIFILYLPAGNSLRGVQRVYSRTRRQDLLLAILLLRAVLLRRVLLPTRTVFSDAAVADCFFRCLGVCCCFFSFSSFSCPEAFFLGCFYELRVQGIQAGGFTRKKVGSENNDGFEGATHLSRPTSFFVRSSFSSSVLKSLLGVSADSLTADLPISIGPWMGDGPLQTRLKY